MTFRYKTLADLQKQFSEAEILTMITRYLDQKQTQRDAHKKYNQRRAAAIKALKESNPDLYEEMMNA